MILLIIVGLLVWYATFRSSYVTHVGIVREQPVLFSHQHHVGKLGFDCRYCHTSVEESAFAGIPSTAICMNCHTQIWNDSPLLAPVRVSWQTRQPLVWTRVHNLPEFTYFNHAIHVAKGIGCQTCHGRVDLMPLMWKTQTLYMDWCLNCHREPERYVQPIETVFDMPYVPPDDQLALGRRLVQEYDIRQVGMTDCNTCHR